jgi:hypothetical protein
VKAISVKATGEITVLDFVNVKGSCLDFLQGQVGGDVECVGFTDKIDMWLNAEGKYNGNSLNLVATKMWRKYYGATDLIMGDVVFTGGVNEDGATRGLGKQTLKDLLAQLTAWQISFIFV